MKILLDENLPKKLKEDFPSHEVYTLRNLNWHGIKNGELLQLMIENNFDVFISFDQNIQYQQNFEKYSITTFILIAQINTYKILQPLVQKIKPMLVKNNLQKGVVIIN